MLKQKLLQDLREETPKYNFTKNYLASGNAKVCRCVMGVLMGKVGWDGFAPVIEREPWWDAIQKEYEFTDEDMMQIVKINNVLSDSWEDVIKGIEKM